MKIKKIQLTKTNTLNVVYSNGDGDTINMTGANIVHRDLKEAVKELVPHLVHLTEQKESKYTLIELQAQRDIEVDSVFSGDVKPDEVPQVTVEVVHGGKKKSKKEKKTA